MVKAQIHAGGRGKGTFDTGYKGGVKVVTRWVSPAHQPFHACTVATSVPSCALRNTWRTPAQAGALSLS